MVESDPDLGTFYDCKLNLNVMVCNPMFVYL